MNSGVRLSSVVEAGGSVHSSGPSRCSNSLIKKAEVGDEATWVLLRFGTPVRSRRGPGRHVAADWAMSFAATEPTDVAVEVIHQPRRVAFDDAGGSSAQNVSVAFTFSPT